MLPAESRVYKALCSDKKCQSVLYVTYTEKTVECFHCGQKHSKDALEDLREVSSGEVKDAVQNYLCRMLINRNTPKRGTEMVKVLGLSNYFCKLLSPLLTRYGMDKTTGQAKLLTEMNQGEIFDCSLFGDRAFLIEPEHISIHGYGKDITGSLNYLSETLKLIVAHNGGEERLIPVHADGDGHCLVHAISRALVGRELFWHPLRCCLKKHFQTNLDKYKELFKEFIDTVEWQSIIDECDPDFQPPDGELHGLRNIHIFGLANVLKRPIILLDSLECMQKCGDYSALFLPGFVSPEECRGKDNTLNKPICIAWSSYSHNHYIPLVGVQQKPLPVLPAVLIPKVWGMPQSQISLYIEFDSNGGCVIGGNRILSDAYIQRLVRAMEVLYYEKNGIHPSLVADAKLYLFPDSLLFSAKPAVVLERAKAAVQDGRLYRCLVCRGLCELQAGDKFSPNNSALCSQYLQNFKRLQEDANLAIPGLTVEYDSIKNEYVINIDNSESKTCTFCNSYALRKVTNDGTVIFRAEDKNTLDKSICGYEQARKYFNEDSFSQKPKEVKCSRLSLNFEWKGKEVQDEFFFDFHHSSKENLNEFVKNMSKKFIKKHFSDNCTDAGLLSYISEEIWKLIRKQDLKNAAASFSKSNIKCEDSDKTVKCESPRNSFSKPSQLQYVKVVTSNGQQSNLALTDEGISYGQLQEWIKNEFKIPVKNQLIKGGFPPRPIKPLGDTNKQMLSDLKHGDRITVEIQRRDDTPYSLNNYPPPRNVLKDSNGPKTSLKSPVDSPSISDTSWDAIKKTAKNFRRNGFMYKKIAENHTLDSSLHITLDEYPNKVFCYNCLSDSIELCVEPLGHFLIYPDIDQAIEDVRNGQYITGFSKCPLNSHVADVNDGLSYLRTIASSQSGGESSNPNLLRKGPGFSVLRNSEDMDFS